MLVREIRGWTRRAGCSCAGFVSGVINLRGTVLRLSTSARLGFPPTGTDDPPRHSGRPDRQSDDRPYGRGVSEILTISQDLIQPTPDVASQMAKDFVSGIVATDGRMISLISLTRSCPQTNKPPHKCHLEHAAIIWAYEPVRGLPEI